MSVIPPPTTQTYQNPVYQRDFPDPFILKYGNGYWAYGTGTAPDGRCFSILHSHDMVTWAPLAGALEPLPGDFPCYWAPEVTYDNGVFYLYYSVGDETTMTVRAATALDPAGPFTDSGHILTHEPFAIDPHVFQDIDGTRYLFYATDFLEHTHIGTGTTRDRLLDPFTLEGKPQPVTRAQYDWQVYHPERPEKGGVRWHTIEGSFVLLHKGQYYQMFSGGNWQNPTYGVSYATTTNLNTTEEWTQASDGETVLPILRTYPEIGVIGPGHNSVVLAPNNRHYYCVYHRWATDGSGRQMAIDPLEWVGERMIVRGPSTTPQPVPPVPIIAGFSNDQQWEFRGGEWNIHNEALLQPVSAGTTEAHHRVGSGFFLLEVLVRAAGEGAAGIQLYDEAGRVCVSVVLHPTQQELTVLTGDATKTFTLPATFNATAFHNLRLDVNGHFLTVLLNGTTIRWQGSLPTPITSLALVTEDTAAEFRGFGVTVGWEDLWTEHTRLADLGWQATSTVSSEQWRLEDNQLWVDATAGAISLIKGDQLNQYELTVNSCFAKDYKDGHYAIYPAWSTANSGPALTVKRSNGLYYLEWSEGETVTTVDLPDGFDPLTYQQFRFRKEGTHLTCWWESLLLGDATITAHPSQIALQANGIIVAFDMVRLTAFS